MFQDVMCADMSAYALGQGVMCTDTSACALGVGTGAVCAVHVQEPVVHPQMLSYFKEPGHVVQDLCASHSPEGSEERKVRKEEEEMERTMAAAVKELKDLMEKQNGNLCLLSRDIESLRAVVLERTKTTNLTVTGLANEVRNLQNDVKDLQSRWDEFIEEEEQARTEYGKYFEEQERIKEQLREDRDRLLENWKRN